MNEITQLLHIDPLLLQALRRIFRRRTFPQTPSCPRLPAPWI